MKYAYHWNVRFTLGEINFKTSNGGLMYINFFKVITISNDC